MRRDIAKRFAKRVTNEMGYKLDLYLADYRTINSDAAQLALGYKVQGTVTVEDVVKYIRATFNDDIVPVPGSVRHYPKRKMLTSIAVLRTDRRKWSDRKGMLCIHANHMYLDTEFDETWAVAVNEKDEPYLVRVRKDDIGSILAARRQRMNHLRTSEDVSLAAIASAISPMQGDLVTVYYDNHIRDGVVTSTSGKGFTVKLKSGGTVTVPIDSILDVKKRGDAFESKDKQEMIDFFTKTYGDEKFARELVNASVDPNAGAPAARTLDFKPPPLKSFRVRAALRKLPRPGTGRNEWAIVSKNNPAKVLRWLGAQRPSDAEVEKVEADIDYSK